MTQKRASSSSQGSRAAPPPRQEPIWNRAPWIHSDVAGGSQEQQRPGGLAFMEDWGRAVGMLEVETVAVADPDVPLCLLFYGFYLFFLFLVFKKM